MFIHSTTDIWDQKIQNVAHENTYRIFSISRSTGASNQRFLRREDNGKADARQEFVRRWIQQERRIPSHFSDNKRWSVRMFWRGDALVQRSLFSSCWNALLLKDSRRRICCSSYEVLRLTWISSSDDLIYALKWWRRKYYRLGITIGQKWLG